MLSQSWDSRWSMPLRQACWSLRATSVRLFAGKMSLDEVPRTSGPRATLAHVSTLLLVAMYSLRIHCASSCGRRTTDLLMCPNPFGDMKRLHWAVEGTHAAPRQNRHDQTRPNGKLDVPRDGPAKSVLLQFTDLINDLSINKCGIFQA